MRTTLLLCTGLFVTAVLVSAQSTTPAPAANTAPAPAGNVAKGKRLYLDKGCWTCHDYEGQGGNGPRLSSTALPLRAFTAYIRSPRGTMPPYLAKVISDAEVADLYAFLQAQPKPAPAKSIPLLNQ
jgi:mono/diheme cytochrome c family protein